MSPNPSALYAGPRDLTIIEKCRFKAHPCQNCGRAKSNPAHKKSGGTCKYKGKLGCVNCGKYKKDFDHLGAPPSLNIFGSGNAGLFINLKQQWEELLTWHLEKADLPYDMASVSVSAKIIFPDDKQKRDEGNLRFFIEKALGDALQAGGWLADDSFYPVRKYTFGQLEAEHRPGVSGMIITIWPET